MCSPFSKFMVGCSLATAVHPGHCSLQNPFIKDHLFHKSPLTSKVTFLALSFRQCYHGQKKLQRQFIPAFSTHRDASKPAPEAEHPLRWRKTNSKQLVYQRQECKSINRRFSMQLGFQFCPPCSPGQHGETSGG